MKRPQTLHKLYEIPKKDNHINMPHFQVFKKDEVHQADLLFLPDDNGFKYLLVVVDIATRLTDAQPIKDKKPTTVLAAIKQIYERDILKWPKYLEVDSGNEFKGQFAEYFKKQKIKLIVAQPGRHRSLAIVERKNQAIGAMLFKLMTARELLTAETNTEWVDDLPDVLEIINKRARKRKIDNTTHSPVCEGDTCNLIPRGTRVRVAYDNPHDIHGKRLHGRFRTSDIRWNPQQRIIEEVLIKPNFPPLYLLDNDPDTAYTKNQLQIISPNEELPDKKILKGKEPKYIIEKILGEKLLKKKKHYLVKWKGWIDPTYEPAKQVEEDVPELVDQYKKNKLKNKNKK